MPRPVHALGRPGTAVVPQGWEEAHRAVVDAFHLCPVSLFHPVDDNDEAATWDEDLEQWVPAAREPYWTGTARIQAVRDLGGAREVAGDEVAVVTYQVTVDAAVEVQAGDTVRVDPTFTGDSMLAGRGITVAQVVRGSLRFERLLYGQLVDDTQG